MRLVLILMLLTAIAVGVVHLRRAGDTVRNEIRDLQIRQAPLRQKLWDQQADIGTLTAVENVRRQVDRQVLPLDPPAERPPTELAHNE